MKGDLLQSVEVAEENMEDLQHPSTMPQEIISAPKMFR